MVAVVESPNILCEEIKSSANLQNVKVQLASLVKWEVWSASVKEKFLCLPFPLPTHSILFVSI